MPQFRPRLAAVLAFAATVAGAQTPRRAIPIAKAIARRAQSETVMVAGRTTAGTGELQSTVFDIAIQDSSAGIRVFSRTVQENVQQGDSLVAVGVVKSYRGDLELVASRVEIVPAQRRIIVPAELSIDRGVLATYAGALVRVRGRVAGYGTSEGGQWMRLRDMKSSAIGTVTIWVPSNHGASIDLSRVRYEDSVVVTGVMTRYQDNTDDPVVFQVVPRTRDDVHVPDVPRGLPAWTFWVGLLIAAGLAAALAVGRWTARLQLGALRETETRYRQLLHLSPDAVIVHADGVIRFANPAAATLLGVASEQELGGKMLFDFVEPDLRPQLGATSTAETETSAPRLRGQLRSSSGALVDVEVTVSPCVYLDRPAHVLLARDITQQLRYERDLRSLALVDELTGLFNRRGFTLFGEQERTRARRDRRTPVVVFADIDGLKQVNDDLGHAAGDRAIQLVASALTSVFRESDIVARWGGDEFVALIGEGGETVADLIDARLQTAIAALRPSALTFPVSVTIGMSPLDPTLPLAEALDKADAELYRKKKGNSGTIRRITPP
jgi:diguanylate cyclase (GGDEF)-like protein/PAS domain S-box-containing protein